jgi:hypothetical protein
VDHLEGNARLDQRLVVAEGVQIENTWLRLHAEF